MNSSASTNITHLLRLSGKDLLDAVQAEIGTNPTAYLADLFALMDQRVNGNFLRLKRSEWAEEDEDGIRTAASDPSSPFWPNRYRAVDLRLAPAALKLARAIRAEHKRYAATAPRSVPERQKMLADHTVPLPVITRKEVAGPDKVRLAIRWAYDEEISDAEFRLAVTLLLGFHNTLTGVCNPSTRTLARNLGWSIRKTEGVVAKLASDAGDRPFRKYVYFDRRTKRKAVQWAPVLAHAADDNAQMTAACSNANPCTPAPSFPQDGGGVTSEDLSSERENQKTHCPSTPDGMPGDEGRFRLTREKQADALPAVAEEPSAGAPTIPSSPGATIEAAPAKIFLVPFLESDHRKSPAVSEPPAQGGTWRPARLNAA